MRSRVACAAGAGMSHEEIALGLGITRKTLLKYFDHELTVGAYRKRLEHLEALHKAGKKGNVAAIRAYAQISVKLAAPPAEIEDKVPDPPKGKKEQAAAAAKTAHQGTEWHELLGDRNLQ